MNQHGFVRITCVSPRVKVADPAANAAEIIRVLEQVADSDLVLFPELCVTGYSCATCSGSRRLWKQASGARSELRKRPREGRNWWSSAHRLLSPTACSTALW